MRDRTEGGSSELLELALELAPAGMLAVNAAGEILLVNREVERLFGYSREELLGRSVDTLLPREAQAAHPAARERYFLTPESRPMGSGRDLYGRRADGSRVPVEIGLNPVDTPHGKVVLASVVDITTRRRTEDQLRQAQKQEAIGTLASGIAHDFNNILLGITGYTELVLRHHPTDSQTQGDLQCILQAADRGRQLVQRLLTFSSQTEVERSPMRPNPVVREALALMRATLTSSIETRATLDPLTPAIVSHETLLHQITMNLVTNSAHAMPHGGVLEVQLAPHAVRGDDSRLPDGLYARLSVLDSGSGMSPEVLSRVMEPFYTTKPQGEGTGLGLPVIHGIVKSHCGLLDIQSQPGKGTRVDVFLPAHLPMADEDGVPGGPRKHVLLVEDEELLLLMLARHMESFGYRVSPYVSSIEALEVFRAQPASFDLLVTDNSMPKLTGLELAREVSATRPELPILLITGLPPASDQLAQYGIRQAILKPCPMDALQDVLSGLLANVETEA